VVQLGFHDGEFDAMADWGFQRIYGEVDEGFLREKRGADLA
jgi:hypothetical protein